MARAPEIKLGYYWMLLFCHFKAGMPIEKPVKMPSDNSDSFSDSLTASSDRISYIYFDMALLPISESVGMGEYRSLTMSMRRCSLSID